MCGEETPALGAGIENGLICSAGTHPKWIEMKNGRMDRFATYMIGEMYGLLREHSMGRTGSQQGCSRGANTNDNLRPSQCKFAMFKAANRASC